MKSYELSARAWSLSVPPGLASCAAMQGRIKSRLADVVLSAAAAWTPGAVPIYTHETTA